MKKIISKLLIFAVLCLCIIGIAGCSRTSFGMPLGKLPEYESGYYKYSVDDYKGIQKAYITGLTELGLEQTELVYPKTIDGYTVYGIGYYYSTGVYMIPAGEVKSENLQKFFMPTLQIENINRPEVFNLDHGKVVNWNSDYGDKNPYNGFLYASAQVYGYNLYEKKREYLAWSNIMLIANVSYMYNYDNAPNDGYYWVDTYDESLITFIPPNPTREGYAFGGWYKEADCTIEWDFEADITGKEIYMDRETPYDEYEGIYLYAKWVPNN